MRKICPMKYTVTFTSSFANTNYAVSLIGTAPRTWIVEDLTTSSFVINSNGNQGFSGTVYWMAMTAGEFNS